MSYTQMSKRIIMVLKNKVVREALKKCIKIFYMKGVGWRGVWRDLLMEQSKQRLTTNLVSCIILQQEEGRVTNSLRDKKIESTRHIYQ